MSLLSHLEKLNSGEINSQELNELIKHSIKTSKAILISGYRHKIAKHDSFNCQMEDLAVDAIVPLFITNGNGEISLIRSLRNWRSKLKSESDAGFFLFKVVANRIEQTLTLFLKEQDPVFSKIITTLNTCISNYDFKKINHITTVYVVRANCEEIGFPLIDEKEFMKLDVELFQSKQFALINGLLDHFEKNKEYFPAIPLNLLVKRIKNLNYNYFARENSSVSNHFTELPFVNSVVDSGLKKIKITLGKKYFETGKLCQTEYQAMVKAFEEMAVDMKNGGICGGLYCYFSNHFSDISHDEFYNNYHGIMNYLYNLLKKDILDNLEKKN